MRSVQGMIFTIKDGFVPGIVSIDDGIIKGVEFFDDEKLASDQRKKYVIPGLIDMHMHGCMSFDTCDASYESLKHIWCSLNICLG